jgi:hypothetical protein
MSQECNTVETLNRLEKQIADLQGNILSQKNVLTLHWFFKELFVQINLFRKDPFQQTGWKNDFF